MFRKLLRRLLLWALEEPPLKVKIGIHKCNAADFFIRGASTPGGRKVITKTVRQAKLDREM